MLLLPPKDLDVSEQAGGRGMTNTDHLIGLALTAVRGAHDLERILIPNHLKAAPEGRRDATIIGILHHGAQLAVLDQLSPLAAKLEFIARVVNRPRAVGLHIDATLHRGNHLFQSGITGLKVEIGHTINRWPVPATGARVGNPREICPYLRGQTTEGTLQDTLADQILALGWLAIIIKAITHILLGSGRIEGNVKE